MPLTRTRTHVVGDLTDAQKRDIRARLVPLVTSHFDVPDEDMVARLVLFRSPSTRITEFIDDAGATAAFLSLDFQRYEGGEGDRPLTIVDAGGYKRPGVPEAGIAIQRRVARAVIARKLRYPTEALAYVGEIASPFAYRLATHWSSVYPNASRAAPQRVQELVTQIVRDRGYETVDPEDPWVVRAPMVVPLSDPARLERALEEHRDEALEFFTARNPGFREGHWLVLYCSCDWAPCLRFVARKLARAITLPFRPRLPSRHAA